MSGEMWAQKERECTRARICVCLQTLEANGNTTYFVFFVID